MRLQTAGRVVLTTEHEAFRDSVRRLFAKELEPHQERWEEAGIVDRSFWEACGAAGLLCPTVSEAYGGPGLDFGYNAVVNEEVAYSGSAPGISLQSDIVAPYIEAYGSEDQKLRWLPGMVAGTVVSAIAMTEPGTGSDLQAIRTAAVRDGTGWRLSGSKTYITNGQLADLVIVAAKTDAGEGAKGVSLFLVEATAEGFSRGRNLDKIGLKSNDTSELFFEDAPAELLGAEGMGFAYLMTQLPQERLSIAVGAQAAAQRAFDEGLRYTKDRKAFGRTVFDFQNTRFTLAGLKTELQVGWAHLDACLAKHVAGRLGVAEACAAKLWHTEMQGRVVDAALQLHGGAGYMNEYLIARLWRDARVNRIFGGTNEIMKEVIGRSL